MASYTALIAPCRNIGSSYANNTQTSGIWFDATGSRPARIRNIMSPHFIAQATGGFITADFVIPPEEARPNSTMLRQFSPCWMFDGQTPIFYGLLDAPTWQSDGSVLITVNGWWQVLMSSAMREIWDDWDTTRLVTYSGNARAGNFSMDSDNSLTLGFGNGSVVALNDRVAVDYLLFSEPVGFRDNKQILEFDVHIGTASYGSDFEFQIIGRQDAHAGGPFDVLYSTSSATAGSILQASGSWPVTTGYRCIRLQFIASLGSGTLSTDRFITLDVVRMSSRVGFLGAFTSAGNDTGAIARDIFVQTSEPLDRYDIPEEFWRPQLGSGAYPYGANGQFADNSQAGDPVIGTGTCLNSGNLITGFNVNTWSPPTDILSQLVAFDGSLCGFYFPINQRTGYYLGGPGDTNPSFPNLLPSQWIGAPPQLVYKPWSSILNPDYYLSIEEGAQVVPDASEQPLVNAEYVNYNTLQQKTFGGQQVSIVTENSIGTPDYGAYGNYLTANGYRRAEIYTIQPSVGTIDASNTATASLIGKQIIALRSQPVSSGTTTLTNDGAARWQVWGANGAVPPKLSMLRPGVYAVVDLVNKKKTAVGKATQIEWWGQTLNSPERVEITTGQPGQMALDRRLAQLQWKADHYWRA